MGPAGTPAAVATRRLFPRARPLAAAVFAVTSCGSGRRPRSFALAFPSPRRIGAPRPRPGAGRSRGGGRAVPVPRRSAASSGEGAGDAEYEEFLQRTPLPARAGAFPFPLPSFTQVLSVWPFGVFVHRVVHRLLSGRTKTTQKLVSCGAVFVAACFFLARTFAEIDYAALESFDRKSLANQAGRWAVEGRVPCDLHVAATVAKADDFNDDHRDRNADALPASYEVATFAGGCFWGTELHFQRIDGVVATCVGYTHGAVARPTYARVCAGTTGHAEGVQLLFDPAECSYERLVTQLFETIDLTLENQVGRDAGTQYRHGVYPHTRDQHDVARALFRVAEAGCADQGRGPVVTELKPAALFWPAENCHQRYLEKKGQSAEKGCEEKVRCYG